MNSNRKITKIGIPRAISYYHNFPFYKGFFEELGINVIVSDKTTSKLINIGSSYVVSETCLPIKVFTGHVINLLDKNVSDIFIPSIQSINYKINNCSKIRGLPEIIRNVINRPINIIEPVLDKTNNNGFYQFWNDCANSIGIDDRFQIKKAISAGWAKYNYFFELVKNFVPYSKAIEIITEDKNNSVSEIQRNNDIKQLSVVIMAHGYNLFDERISLNLIKKLEKMNVNVYTALNVSKKDCIKSIQDMGELIYWANELDLTGTAAYYLLNEKIDGIIALSAFGCGPDSLMVDEIRFHANKKNIPMIYLTIDEHTGEAGFITRLEAFTDMLFRKKYNFLNKKFKSSDNINICTPKELCRI